MKMFIAIAVFALLVGIGLAAYKKIASGLTHKYKKTNDKSNVQEVTPERQTAQSLVPIHDFQGHCVVNTCGDYIVFIKVEGANLSLATEEEKDAQIEKLSEALSGEQHPYTIYRLLAPIDMTPQVRALRHQIELIEEEELQIIGVAKANQKIDYSTEKRLSALRARKELIEAVYMPQYLNQDAMYRSESYVVMAFRDGFDVQKTALDTASDFISRMITAGYQATLLNPEEITRLLINYNGRFPIEGESLGLNPNHSYQPAMS